MTNAQWPDSYNQVLGEIGGFLNFYAQEFEIYVDNRSALTSGNSSTGTQGGVRTAGGVHNITLPYVNTITNETSTWDTNNSNDYLNRTDADTGLSDIAIDLFGDIYDMVDFWYTVQTLNMEVSNAGYKGPVLRQRHYSYNLINRTGTAKEGEEIASICRAFQASVYPKMSPNWRVADNIVMPPPMWTISYLPSAGAGPNPHFDGVKNPYTGVDLVLNPLNPGWPTFKTRERGHNPNHPSIFNAGHNKWRWNMDPFTSVLVNVSISPTSATDSIQVPTASGWPLVTVLKLSFLEVDQVLSNQKWDAIIPYSWAQDEDSKFFRGGQASGL